MLPERSPRGAARSPEREREMSYLLGRAARGDGEAFAQLYDMTSGAVYGMALRMLRDRETAAEVTQEVFVEVWRQAARFDPARGSVMTWVTMIGHRRAVDRVRRERALGEREERAARLTSAPDASPSDEVLAGEERTTVRAAVDSLPPLQREALTLAYFGGHSYPEVAALLQIPLGTAKTRIRQGLQRLREQMELAT